LRSGSFRFLLMRTRRTFRHFWPRWASCARSAGQSSLIPMTLVRSSTALPLSAAGPSAYDQRARGPRWHSHRAVYAARQPHARRRHHQLGRLPGRRTGAPRRALHGTHRLRTLRHARRGETTPLNRPAAAKPHRSKRRSGRVPKAGADGHRCLGISAGGVQALMAHVARAPVVLHDFHFPEACAQYERDRQFWLEARWTITGTDRTAVDPPRVQAQQQGAYP